VGRIVTRWLPWIERTAKIDRTWSPPEVGEQVLLLSPSGDHAQAVVLPAIFHEGEQTTPPADRPTVDRIVYGDGGMVEYDREAGRYTIDLTEPGGEVLIVTGETKLRLLPDRAEIKTPLLDLNP